MFTVALFTITKIWKQPKCLSTDEWIRCGTYIYIYTHNGTLLSHKKNEIKPFAATWMDLEIIFLSEARQKQISCDIAYMWNLKKTQYK